MMNLVGRLKMKSW